MSDMSQLRIDDRGVAWLTLTRPEVHNAFDDALIGELNAHLDQVRQAADSSNCFSAVVNMRRSVPRPVVVGSLGVSGQRSTGTGCFGV